MNAGSGARWPARTTPIVVRQAITSQPTIPRSGTATGSRPASRPGAIARGAAITRWRRPQARRRRATTHAVRSTSPAPTNACRRTARPRGSSRRRGEPGDHRGAADRERGQAQLPSARRNVRSRPASSGRVASGTAEKTTSPAATRPTSSADRRARAGAAGGTRIAASAVAGSVRLHPPASGRPAWPAMRSTVPPEQPPEWLTDGLDLIPSPRRSSSPRALGQQADRGQLPLARTAGSVAQGARSVTSGNRLSPRVRRQDRVDDVLDGRRFRHVAGGPALEGGPQEARLVEPAQDRGREGHRCRPRRSPPARPGRRAGRPARGRRRRHPGSRRRRPRRPRAPRTRSRPSRTSSRSRTAAPIAAAIAVVVDDDEADHGASVAWPRRRSKSMKTRNVAGGASDVADPAQELLVQLEIWSASRSAAPSGDTATRASSGAVS